VHLGGGLGNQLFQYAFGRRIALANSAELIIDASGYADVVSPKPERGIRTLALQHFDIQGTLIMTRSTTRQQRAWISRKFAKQWKKVRNSWEGRKPYYLRREVWEPEENHFRYDGRVLQRSIGGTVDYYGYWQTEKYFSAIEGILRRELALQEPPRGKNAELARLASAPNSVSIHVRHGDNAGVAAALGVLPVSYYDRACSELSRQVPGPRFFVFSDDPQWARSTLVPGTDTIYVSHNGEARDYEDLRLMSLCRHHICANSTFSWWGAWLGKKSGQIVYAPRRYYQNIDRPNPDLYPADWRLI